MPKFTIKAAVTEIHHVTYEVEADDLESAIEAIEEGGEGDEIDTSFEETVEAECIRVLEIDDEQVPDDKQLIGEDA